MSRLIAILLVLFAASAFLLLFPAIVQATQPPPPEPVYRLNSEGDEWILVDSSQVEPKPAAPDPIQPGEGEARPLVYPETYLPPSDGALEIALDRARDAGPEAVLAFVAAQPDPHHPLLEAALQDAQYELSNSSLRSPSSPNEPRVSLNSGPCTFETIQAAVDAATNGDTVRIAAGIFAENVDITGKNLTIDGGYNSTCTTLTASTTQIQASVAGSVVDVSGTSVLTLRNLDLSGGTLVGAGMDVLGSSRVTLSNTDIHNNNSGTTGGGIYLGSTSVITFTNDSDIYNNTATIGGGAIVYGTLYGFMSTSDVYLNSAVNGGGIAVSGGTVVLDNSDVVANTASDLGGGFYLTGGGVITLTNSTFVGESNPCCQSAANGGGIYASGSSIFLEDGSTTVANNTATNNGGGLYLVNDSTLTVSGSSIGCGSVNAGNDAVLGAGLYVDTSTVNFSGQIINNIASTAGGGVYATNSAITMTNTTVGGTGLYQHNQIGASGLNGAGMYLINNTHANFDNTVIISNTLSNPGTGYAGGIYVRAGSVITMTDSRIEQHFLPSSFDGRGAGLYIYDATVTLDGTQVISNTASGFGGGARMFGTSTLNIIGGSSFINNKALNGGGGAIAATSTPDIDATDAIFRYNSASGDGGAIFLDSGTLDFDGTWDVRFNQALGNGGAVAVQGTGDADFHVTAGPSSSYLAGNIAGGNGGALYVSNTDTLQFYATSGYELTLSNNSAGGNGGAGYGNAGAYFDVYGSLVASSNTAVGNGGVFYLSNASRIWLDDYVNIKPLILINTAANGGAIYASNSPSLRCDGAEFGGNVNGNSATAGSGGAIYLSGSTFLAENCIFRNNQAVTGHGGAIAAYTSTLTIDTDYPAALSPVNQIEDRSSPSAPLATACDPRRGRQCSSLYSNFASNGYGGAIFTSGSNLTVSNTYLHHNTAQRGGAIYQEGATSGGSLANVLVYSNTSIQAFGAGVRVAGGAMTMWHATLAYNTGGAGYSPGTLQSYIYDTIIWGNTSPAFGALAEAVCNIDQGGTAGPATNPLFLSPGVGEDYRLGPGSPATNACSTGLPRVSQPTSAVRSVDSMTWAYSKHNSASICRS